MRLHAEQDSDEQRDAEDPDQAGEDRGKRIGDEPSVVGTQRAHAALVTDCGEDERRYPDANHQSPEPPWPDGPARGRTLRLPQVLEELVDGKSEGDKRRGRADPRHQCSFMREPGSFPGEVCRLVGSQRLSLGNLPWVRNAYQVTLTL